jgi:hypothetical protein
MSSSRSIAAARQRRAGEAPPVAQRGPGTSINSQQAFAQQQMQQQPGNPNQLPPQAPQVPVGKLSIGDAFALVTIRLGRIETIIQKLEAEGVIGPNAVHTSDSMEHDENMRLVDDTVIRNVIARLGDLEKGQTKLTALAQNKQEPELNGEEVYKMVESQTSDLQNQVNQLKNELRDTKEMLMKLQSFSMETNQKIISIVLTQEKQETLLKNVETEIENKPQSNPDNEVSVNADEPESQEKDDGDEADEVIDKLTDDVTDEVVSKTEEVTEQVASKSEVKKSIKKDIKKELLKINNDDV